MADFFPPTPLNGQIVEINGTTYQYEALNDAWRIYQQTSANVVVADNFLYANGSPVSGSGAVGYTGSVGTGYTGSSGAIGYTGSAGQDGIIGVDGYTGSAGIDGNIGYTGSAGAGYTGSAGQDGIIGVDGYTGSRGDIGYTGSSSAVDKYINLSMPGAFDIPHTGTAKFYPVKDITITKINANTSAAPEQELTIVLNKNGVDLGYTLTIPTTTNLMTPVTANLTVSTTDYLSVDITGPNTTVSDLYLILTYT